MSSSLRQLLAGDYIPFGTQYYRAPSPRSEDWEQDLKKIASLGFNTVKFWVQWRWNHPAEDKFFFDDIDRLMDLAQENNLRVILNTIFDVAPAWVYRKFPDASMMTLDGRRIGPQTQPHRQVGGLGLCLNHLGAMEYFFGFLRETVRRYKDHPALEIWNVASEPELTSSMAEIRLYADNAEKIGDMLCYCDNCKTAFVAWLKEKYDTVEQLNISWNRNYRSFDEIELPKTRNTFNDIIDWRMFFVHTLGENVKRRFDVAREADEGKHPLMCHHVFIQGFPLTSTANDPWNVGQYGDLHGCTQMDDPMMGDVLRSCAKGKPVISAEMLMLFGYTLNVPKSITLTDIKRYIFTGVAANLKGFIFWQYRPEILGREAPAWGLTYLDGKETPWLQGFSEVGKVLQDNATFILEAEPRKADIAILYNPENQIFSWAATGNEKTATDSLLGTHKALYERNFNVDFIHAFDVSSKILQNYKVIFVPFPYCLNESICKALESWVKDGGTLIGESYFAGWHREHGQHQTTVPGYGLHQVFKVRQATASPGHDSRKVEIQAVRSFPFVKKGQKASGTLVKETFFIEGAEVWAKFVSGEPAITCSRYGNGKAILIGTYLALPYYRTGLAGNDDFIAGLVASALNADRPSVDGRAKVRLDVLQTSGKEVMLIIRNLEARKVQVSIRIPGIRQRTLREQFSGETLKLVQSGQVSKSSVRLAAGEVKVYRG